jgi:hypothetical protein
VRVVVAAHDAATDSRKRGPISLGLAPSNVRPNANLSATAHRIVNIAPGPKQSVPPLNDNRGFLPRRCPLSR